MSIDSGPESLPRKNRRVAKRSSDGDISSALREQITRSAQRIREAHKAELADVLKADRAGRLFRSIIRPKAGSGDAVGALAGELGGLLNDAIRAGTGLLEGPLTSMIQAWMATVAGPAARPKLRTPSVAEPGPGVTSSAQPSSASQMADTAGDSAICRVQTSEAPAVGPPEELMLLGVFRQFMPMLLTALADGGDGHALAETVITLLGRPPYDQACGLGKDKIMQLVKGEPDLWQQVAPIETEFSRFLEEFTGYDAWTEEQKRQTQKPPLGRGRTKPPAE